jgi:hypothetical protein
MKSLLLKGMTKVIWREEDDSSEILLKLHTRRVQFGNSTLQPIGHTAENLTKDRSA